MKIPEKYMLPAEAAAFLGVSRMAIYTMREKKLLRPFFLYGCGKGRPTFYLKEEVERFFEENIKGGDLI